MAGELDCSLNDLGLTIASTALRRYLLAQGRVPSRSLTVGVPVNLLGLGGRALVQFSVTVSVVPGPSDPLYFHGARPEAIFPESLLPHGNALKITCVSYAVEPHFGLTGTRDNLPHPKRLATETLSAVEDVAARAA